MALPIIAAGIAGLTAGELTTVTVVAGGVAVGGIFKDGIQSVGRGIGKMITAAVEKAKEARKSEERK